jgi:hypothetical protein
VAQFQPVPHAQTQGKHSSIHIARAAPRSAMQCLSLQQTSAQAAAVVATPTKAMDMLVAAHQTQICGEQKRQWPHTVDM